MAYRVITNAVSEKVPLIQSLVLYACSGSREKLKVLFVLKSLSPEAYHQVKQMDDILPAHHVDRQQVDTGCKIRTNTNADFNNLASLPSTRSVN